MVHKIDLIEWDDKAKGTFPLIEELQRLRAINADLLAACEFASNGPAKARAMMEREGFVIDDLDDRWQKLAFTLYNALVANAIQADATITKMKGEE